MPLMQGKSKGAFQHNLKAEMHAGKPQKQALAIAYAVKRKNARKKMAEGGDVGDPNDAGAAALSKGLTDLAGGSGGSGGGSGGGGGLSSMLPMLAMLHEGGMVESAGDPHFDYPDSRKPGVPEYPRAGMIGTGYFAKGGMASGPSRMAMEVMRRRVGAQNPEMLAGGGDIEADDVVDSSGLLADAQSSEHRAAQREQERASLINPTRRAGTAPEQPVVPKPKGAMNEAAAKREAERQQVDETMHSRVPAYARGGDVSQMNEKIHPHANYAYGDEVNAEHEHEEHLMTPEERKNARRGMLSAILSSIHQRHGK